MDPLVKTTVLTLCICYVSLVSITEPSSASSTPKSMPSIPDICKNQTIGKEDVCKNQTVGRQNDFSHYVLSEIHPPAYCLSGKKFSCEYIDIVSPWTLHGLWPTRGREMGPLCCSPDADFDGASIMDLLPRLMKEWTSLKKNSSCYDFWRHEWVKHGTCCPDHLHPEYSYLNHTLTLFENGLNFDKILRNAGITPSGSRLYKAKDIAAAFGEGRVDELLCHKIDGKNMLTEIRICLDSHSFTPRECPKAKTHEKCGKSSEVFYIPT